MRYGVLSTDYKQCLVFVSLHLQSFLFYPNNANEELGVKKGTVADKQRCQALLIETSRS